MSIIVIEDLGMSFLIGWTGPIEVLDPKTATWSKAAWFSNQIFLLYYDPPPPREEDMRIDLGLPEVRDHAARWGAAHDPRWSYGKRMTHLPEGEWTVLFRGEPVGLPKKEEKESMRQVEIERKRHWRTHLVDEKYDLTRELMEVGRLLKERT